jgi:hypothetical protein
MLHLKGNLFGGSAPISRRGFLTVGGLAPLGVSLAQVMAVRQAKAESTKQQTSAILFFMAGGPSHIDMYDRKPDQVAEVRGPFGGIETNLPGLQVCDLMPRHAGIADRLSVVRSITHNLGVHDDATHWLQTGYPLLNARQQGQQNPSQGSVVSFCRDDGSQQIPPYVCIPEDYRRHMGFYESAAFLSSRHNALNAGSDPSV